MGSRCGPCQAFPGALSLAGAKARGRVGGLLDRWAALRRDGTGRGRGLLVVRQRDSGIGNHVVTGRVPVRRVLRERPGQDGVHPGR